MSKTLSVALGLREKVEKDFKNMIDDMYDKSKNKQGIFQGFRYTFDALKDQPDQPEKKKFQAVSSTVAEQLSWLKNYSEDYFNTVLSIEKTNSQNVTADLVVGGTSWGNYSTLELLRLKGIVESKLRGFLQILPIRPETAIWKPSTDSVYEGRPNIFETPLETEFTTTTLKRVVIVDDKHQTENPNIVRQPVTQQIDTPINTGKVTKQVFSGAITNRERALIEVRLNNLLKGIITSLEKANATELLESDLGQKTLAYLF